MILCNDARIIRAGTTQLLRTMKLITIILFTACITASAKGLSQRVTLSVKNVPLETVFHEIEKQTGYYFAYTREALQNTNKVSLEVKNVMLDEVLTACLKDQSLTYSITEKVISIKRANTPILRQTQDDASAALSTPPPIDVHGRIVNENGEPVAGASVKIKGTDRGTSTNDNGEFTLKNADAGAILIISGTNIETFEIKVNNRTDLATLTAKTKVAEGEEVKVTYSTGYQQVPKERATGSFTYLDNKLINRTTSGFILDRLVGMSLGVNGKFQQLNLGLTADPTNKPTLLTIRGLSTLSSKVGINPLIVLDDFPYEGDLSNINPNDIESVTILKDAAAASIWGARAGNGVIVLTTKKGSLNRKMEVSLNSNITIAGKPDIMDNPFFISASDYIDIETVLFNKNFYNSNINNRTSWPFLSPVVEILNKQRAGQISADEATRQLNALKNNDVRRDQLKYLYQNVLNSQNSIGIRGGSNNMTYSLSVGYDNNHTSLVRNIFSRTSINAITVYKPVKNLEITTAINYGRSNYAMNNTQAAFKYPYDKLADNAGNPLPTYGAFRASYIDSLQRLGFQNWQYFPLQELYNSDNTIRTSDILLKIGAKYRIIPGLNIEVNYQNEHQASVNRNYQNTNTFYVRNLVNQFTQYNSTTHAFTYKVPLGSILNMGNSEYNSNNYRAQADFSRTFNKNHEITAIAGAELRQLKTTAYSRLWYGYDDETGVSNNSLDFSTALPKYPSGTGTIPSPSGSISGVTLRYISYYANAAYTYRKRYTFTISGRKDGSNIFGVKTNDRITPLWSTGVMWDISKEAFYHSGVLPYLKLRMTYGYNGNVYNGSAYVTGRYSSTGLTGASVIYNLTAPNPELSWERVRTANIGMDFSSNKDIVSGTIDIYQKNGIDLIEAIALAASTGFTSFTGNAASTRTRGVEVMLTTKNLDRKLKWNTTLLLNSINDKITKFDVTLTSASVQANGGVVGKAISGIFSYKWAGLDPANGDPQGYLNGKISKDYAGIINNYNPDSLVYNGSADPRIFGSLRNDFSFKAFTLSFNIVYKLGYYFRRYSTGLNYSDIVNLGSTFINIDYEKRWKNPGDEKYTDVPSLVYPSNANRNTFYKYSSILVTKGDHIRLQDIRLDYDISKLFKSNLFKSFSMYGLVNNVGILWRANKFNIDPDTYGAFTTNPNRVSFVFGINTTF